MLAMSNIDNNAPDDNRCNKLVKDKKKYRRCKNSRTIASLYCNLHLNLAIKSEKVASKDEPDKEISKESIKPQPLAQKHTYNSQCNFIKSIGQYKIRCRLMKLVSSDYCKQHSNAQPLKKATAATSTDHSTPKKDAEGERKKENAKVKESTNIINGKKVANKKLEKVEVAASSAEIIVLKQDKKVEKTASSVEKTKLKIDKKSKITDYITKTNIKEQTTNEVCSKSGSYEVNGSASIKLDKHESTSLIESQSIIGNSILRLENYLNTTILTDSNRFSKRFDNNKTNTTVEAKCKQNNDDNNNNIRFSKEDIEYKLIKDILTNKKEKIDFRELNRYNRNSINFIKDYRDF